MSASITCPFCRYANPPNNLLCANCAGRLTVGTQHTTATKSSQNIPTPQGSGPTPWVWKSIEASRQTGIGRTKTGLLLMIVGLILASIPYVTYIGSILVIIGGIMVILGRNSFGTSHSKKVIASIAAYCLGIVISFVTGILLALSIVQDVLGGGGQATVAQSLTDAFNVLLVGALIGGIVIAVAYVLITLALQDSLGRLLLYAAFAAELAVGVLVIYIVSGQVATAVSQSFASGSFDPGPLNALQSQLQYLKLLGLVPAALFGAAYYRVYSRISKGEIPQPITPTGSAAPL